ncbi:MAG: PASTA domain-containing protein, partial [Acidimicrobiales bacterium]|nr:PASTA domain-containing protein [Acidimicrobiales bacterium]
RVTNHGYTNGTANPLQSVLQAGTAVLVDRNGVPRARCACGNPHLPPQPTTNTTYTGTPWNNISAEALVRVTPNDQPVERFVLHDAATGKLFIRPVGTDGDADELLGGAAAKTTTTTGTTVAGSGSTSSTGTTGQGAEGLGSTSSTDGVTDTTGGTVPDTGPTVTRTSPTVTAIEPTVTVTVTEPTVTVTQPPPKIAVPDVLGRPGTEAQATVEKAGLRAVVVTTETARAQPGTVIAQDPAGGTQVDKGATVTITVAKAPPPPAKVTVPTLAGQTSADALAALKRVGLNGSVQFVPVAGAPGDRVVRSEPAAGVVVDQGSTVVLTVSQALTNGPAR